MKLHRILPLILGALLGFGSQVARAELPPLIPRDVLFGNPERTRPRISPDGKHLAWLAPDNKNVLQVWVKTIGKNDEHVVTSDKKRGIGQYAWAENNHTLLYLQDNDGDENFHLYGVDLEANSVKDFTPTPGTRSEILAIDPSFPEEILVSSNQRNRELFDVYRLNLKTGTLTLDTKNPGDVSEFKADPKLQVRAAQITTPNGGTEIRIRDNVNAPWKTWLKVGANEILNFVDFSIDGQSAILNSSIGADTARIVIRNIKTNKEKVLANNREVDAGEVVIQPKTHLVQAVSFAPGRTRWVIVSPSVQADFSALLKLYNGDFTIVNRDTADKNWLVSYTSDIAGDRYYLWDRTKKQGSLLLVTRPKLENLTLARTEPVLFDARDGLKLRGYLTLPVGVPARRLPMVLFVHGGPWYRDTWGFNPSVQWFANRGYAVLQVNYRGSTGYGKTFLNAGNKQWGLKMHNDLIDSVDWASSTGLVDSKKVAIYGGSYGGYAALAGVAFTPKVFACAVDIVGPSNLKTLIANFPVYWQTDRAIWNTRTGNIDDPNDAELLKNASPLFKADQIIKPLLIGQGANDPRVTKVESDQIVEAIEKNGGKVTYVLYPDEGHGFARPENRTDFNARAEKFLAENIGGRYEPLSGEKILGSTAVVREISGAVKTGLVKP
ncbi:MAG: S9 family peptidase [Anaerolineae bacterium]|nr:S9 family peptidase [Gloeobacterales cyanobacterium ES-bin-313]